MNYLIYMCIGEGVRIIDDGNSIFRSLQQQMNQEHEEMEEHPHYTNQAGLLRLHELAEALSQHPAQCDKQLRQYTSVYVECHHRSQQFFITLCEHRFIMLLLQNETNVEQPVCILECLNLLLANTKQSSQMVYFLSQNAVHDYLFAPSILNKDTQFIQYYVQLIKTLLMKISEHEENKSLIRIFCNSKYPTFPILTYVTILAGDPNELIKVTAQQCILVLVGLINEKKIYSIYLSQPPMLVFIVRLATEFLKPGTDHQGVCKYFADLMYELKNNRVPLLLLSNILCNVIIVSSLPHKISVALSFVELLTKSIETRVLQHKGLAIQQSKSDGYYKRKGSKSNKYYQMFEQSACDNLVIICSVHYRVIIKYMTNKYVNATYLSAYAQLCPSSAEQPQASLPLKVSYPGIQAQCKILQDYSLKKYIDEEYPASQVELGSDFIHDIKDSLNQYESSRQFIKLKDSYLKKIGNGKVQPSTSFFGRIFNRGSSEQLNTQYIKYISDFSSIVLCKGEPVSINIGKNIVPSTCPFISEYILLSFALQKGLKYDHIKTGQESDSVQPNQIHFNDIRSQWSFTQVNLDIISVMTRRFIQFINSQTEVVSLVVPKLYIPPCYLFLGQLKDYLAASIHQHINKQPKNSQLVQSMPMLISLSKICSLLNVQLGQTSYVSLVNQLTALHQQLQTCLFQNGFKDVVDYIKAKNKLSAIQLEEKNKLNNSKQMDKNLDKSDDKKLSNIKIKVKPSITFLKLCAFQCIQKIMDPHIKPLNKHFQTKWRQTFKKSPTFFEEFHEQNLSNFKVSYFGKNGCTLCFTKLIMPPTIVLRVELNNKKLLQCDILDLQGIKRNSIDNRVLQFGGGNVQNVKTETSQIGDEILEKFKEYRFIFEECVTSATLQYLAGTNQTLALKGKKMRFSYSRKSNDYETPQ